MATPPTDGKEDIPEVLLPFLEKFSALEAKYSALEERFIQLQEKTSTITKVETEAITKEESIPSEEAAPGTNTESGPEKVAAKVTNDPEFPPSRANVLISRIDRDSGERKDQRPNEPSPSTPPKTDVFHAFTLRKFIEDREDDNYGEIEITNQNLWNLLKHVLGHWHGHTFDGPPVILESPYEPFILYWDNLQEVADEEVEEPIHKEARSDLKLLLTTLSNGSGDAKLDKYFKGRESSLDQGIITHETLWTIFPPGTLVYGRFFQGQDQIFLVADNYGLWPYPERDPWVLKCLMYDWDGKMFKRAPVNLAINQFEGHKAISSLPFFPIQFHENREAIQEVTIKRGKRYRDICTAKHADRMFGYDGQAVFEQKGFSKGYDEDEDDDDQSRSATYSRRLYHRFSLTSESSRVTNEPRPVNIDGRVMVDFESYFRYGPEHARIGNLIREIDNGECICNTCRKNKGLQEKNRTSFDEESSQQGKWSDEQYMLCPPRVLGYILRDKQWAQLQVNLLTDISKDAFSNSWSERLQLADGNVTKDIILNLVSSHGTGGEGDQEQKLDVDDIVANKGKGLVILLYGPPGVGKTTTAETVALAAPDVGDKAKKVEKNLAKIFSLASSWQAILLIDEADVFLESRGQGVASNVERNSLVSVFLRVLEYYQGILMLTTNQIAQFDVAIKSRIHVAFKYDELNPTQTLAIFNGFLGSLQKKGLIANMGDINEWLTEDVQRLGLDGRQIRNIVTSAMGLARAEAKANGTSAKLSKKHLKAMVTNVKDFKDEFIKAFERYKTSQRDR
ncbi:hypothetical protein ACMFMG_009269 [Clarireedia jacksonii]